MYLKLWRLLAPFHKKFYKLILIMIVYETCQVFFSYLVSSVVRLYEMNVQLTVWFFSFVLLVVAQELFMRLDNGLDWHIIRQSHAVYKYLKLKAIDQFLKLDRSWHQKHNSGILVGQVSDGVWKALAMVDNVSWEFLPTLIQTVISTIPLLYFSFPTAVLCYISLIAFVLLTWRGEVYKRSLRKARHDQYDSEWQIGIEAIQAHETVVMFGQQRRILSDLDGVHDKVIDIAFKEHLAGVFFFNRWRIRMLNLTRAAIFFFWVSQLYAGSLDIASLIFVSVLSEKLLNSFWRFARLADNVTNNSEGVRRFVNLMSTPVPVHQGKEAPDISRAIEVELRGVCFDYSGEYDEDNGALHNLDLKIRPGKMTAIVGPSGAGKTTIRKVITGLWPIQGGQILIQGRDIKDFDPEKLLEIFSYVPQGDDVAIFDETVKYNIALSRPNASVEEIESSARMAGIHNFIISLEKGYDTMVGERGVRLSGGQKQRLALARAILANRQVLILDEATSAIDSITEEEIQSNMAQILRGKTSIVVAHRLSTIRQADEIVVMDKGGIVGQGTHEELMTDCSLYSQMVTAQNQKM